MPVAAFVPVTACPFAGKVKAKAGLRLVIVSRSAGTAAFSLAFGGGALALGAIIVALALEGESGLGAMVTPQRFNELTAVLVVRLTLDVTPG